MVTVLAREIERDGARSVEISVTDSGQGIDAKFLPFVFDRFRQADASTTRRHGGLGLGLSIVKSLVEMHQGSVEALSDGEGWALLSLSHCRLRIVIQVPRRPLSST